MMAQVIRPRHIVAALLLGPAQDVQQAVARIAVRLDHEVPLPRLFDLGRVLLGVDVVEAIGPPVELFRYVQADYVGGA